MPEMFEKNRFIRFAKIPVPPIITMLGKMPNHKADAVRSFIHPSGRHKEGRLEQPGDSIYGWEGMDSMDDMDIAYQTSGACFGFGFRKGESFYVNETLRCGDRSKQSRATVLIYLALHYCDIDSNGFCPYGNTREIARLTSLTVRTVRNSLRKLAKSGYIQIGSILRDGDFTFYEPDYKNIGLTYVEGGRGYLNLEDGMLRQLASVRDVNSLRAALRMLITVDNPRSSGETVVRGRNLRLSMPGYVTKEMFQKSIDKIRRACSFLDIAGNLESDFFMVSLPKKQDAKVRKAESDLENLKEVEEYTSQLSSLYGKEYDEAESFHNRFGKYPPYFNVFDHEKDQLDRELIFKAGRDEVMQYASMATQYGIGIVKRGLKYIANEVSVFRKQIDSKPAYLRRMIRRHPDGIFNSMEFC